MSVHIKPSIWCDNAYCVNDKEVRMGMDGNWICNAEMTETEKRFFAEYIAMLEHTSATEIAAFYKN